MIACIKNIAAAVGASDPLIANALVDFIATGSQLLLSLKTRDCSTAIYGVLRELNDMQYSRTKRVFDSRIINSACDAILNAISNASPEERLRACGAHAGTIPAIGIKYITRILHNLCVVGNILEYVPHESRTMAHTSKGQTYVVREMPNMSGIRGMKIQTIVANVIHLRSFSHMIIDAISATVECNPAIFAIIVHDAETTFNGPHIIATIPLGQKYALTAMSGCEKKIIAVSDIIRTN